MLDSFIKFVKFIKNELILLVILFSTCILYNIGHFNIISPILILILEIIYIVLLFIIIKYVKLRLGSLISILLMICIIFSIVNNMIFYFVDNAYSININMYSNVKGALALSSDIIHYTMVSSLYGCSSIQPMCSLTRCINTAQLIISYCIIQYKISERLGVIDLIIKQTTIITEFANSLNELAINSAKNNEKTIDNVVKVNNNMYEGVNKFIDKLNEYINWFNIKINDLNNK